MSQTVSKQVQAYDESVMTHCWLTVWCWCWLCWWHGRRHCRHIHWSVCSCRRHLLMLGWWIANWLTYGDCCTMLIITARYQCLLWCTIRWLNCWGITAMNLGISLNILLYFLVIRRLKPYTVSDITNDVTAIIQGVLGGWCQMVRVGFGVYGLQQQSSVPVDCKNYCKLVPVKCWWHYMYVGACWHMPPSYSRQQL